MHINELPWEIMSLLFSILRFQGMRKELMNVSCYWCYITKKSFNDDFIYQGQRYNEKGLVENGRSITSCNQPIRYLFNDGELYNELSLPFLLVCLRISRCSLESTDIDKMVATNVWLYKLKHLQLGEPTLNLSDVSKLTTISPNITHLDIQGIKDEGNYNVGCYLVLFMKL